MRKGFFGLLIFIGLLFLASCSQFQSYFQNQFPELDTTTYMRLNGEILAPVAKANVTLGDLIPKKQDSEKFWIEVDSSQLIHIRAKKSDIFSFTLADLGYTPPSIPIIKVNLPATNLLPFWTPAVPINLNTKLRGTVFLDSPKVDIILRSYITANVDVKIDSLNFANSITGVSQTYPSEISLQIPASDGVNPSIAHAVIDRYSFDSLPYALLIKPDQMKIHVLPSIPAQDVSTIPTTDQKIEGDLSVDIPTILYLKDVILTDTTDFALNQLADFNGKLAVYLKTLVDNGIALGGKFYLAVTDKYFTDTIFTFPATSSAQANDTLSIFVGPHVVTLSPAFYFDPAITDQLGNVISNANTTSVIKLPEYAVEAIKNYLKDDPKKVMKLLIIAKLNTYNSDKPQVVRINANQKISIKIGAKIDYDTSL